MAGEMLSRLSPAAAGHADCSSIGDFAFAMGSGSLRAPASRHLTMSGRHLRQYRCGSSVVGVGCGVCGGSASSPSSVSGLAAAAAAAAATAAAAVSWTAGATARRMAPVALALALCVPTPRRLRRKGAVRYKSRIARRDSSESVHHHVEGHADTALDAASASSAALEETYYAEYLRPPSRLSSSDWVDSIKSLPKSQVLYRIRNPLLSMTLMAVVASIWHCVFKMPGLATLSAHTLLGSALSLLLVFRTNSAYQRFQEGRKIWNDILDLCRDIAFSVSVYRGEVGHKKCRMIRNLVQAFPFAMQRHVRAKTATSMKERLERLLQDDPDGKEPRSDKNYVGGIAGMGWSKNRPLLIISRLMRVVASVPNQQDVFTNRERVWLLTMVNSLSHTIGRCERLVQTPVPLSYARHTGRFVSIWTFTLSLALVESLGWVTIPVVFFVTWALFGILEIGHIIEDPFRRTIDLTPICEAIYHDCARALPSEPSRMPTPEPGEMLPAGESAAEVGTSSSDSPTEPRRRASPVAEVAKQTAVAAAVAAAAAAAAVAAAAAAGASACPPVAR